MLLQNGAHSQLAHCFKSFNTGNVGNSMDKWIFMNMCEYLVLVMPNCVRSYNFNNDFVSPRADFQGIFILTR